MNHAPSIASTEYVRWTLEQREAESRATARAESPPTAKVYLLPPIQHSRVSGLKVLFLTDGNNRAKGLNQGYDAGGKTIVRIAQALARRGDVSTMVACIMSADNASKRGLDFFWKLYQAFSALGMRIAADGELQRENIRLEAYGQLAELRRAGELQAKFVDMVDSVCEKTAHLEKPSLQLLFGINYDRNIALDLGVDVIYRSGMEEACTLRLSGIRTRQGIRCFSSPGLWPTLAVSEVEEVLDAAKRSRYASFATGYDSQFLGSLLRAADALWPAVPLSLTIPFAGSIKSLRRELDALEEGLLGPGPAPRINLFSEDDCLLEARNRDQDSTLEVNLVPGQSIAPRQQRYSDILAASENKQYFLLPDHFEVSYANIHYCELSVSGILQGIHSALAFAEKHQALHGAERPMQRTMPAEKKTVRSSFTIATSPDCSPPTDTWAPRESSIFVSTDCLPSAMPPIRTTLPLMCLWLASSTGRAARASGSIVRSGSALL